MKWTAVTVVVTAAIAWIAASMILSPSSISRIIDKYAPEYIDAKVNTGRVDVSLFSNFPYLRVTIDDFSITYPHERHAKWDTTGAPGLLRQAGRSPEADTLASFRHFILSVNYMAAIAGKIRIREASLESPRIYAHSFSPDSANWNIFKPLAEDPDDEGPTEFPDIRVNRISLTRSPNIVYTSVSDTIFATIMMKEAALKGRLSTEIGIEKDRMGISIEEARILGRLPSDTVSISIDHFGIHDHDKAFHIHGDADVAIALKGFGRAKIPVGIEGSVAFPQKGAIQIDSLAVNAGKATACLDGSIALQNANMHIDAGLTFGNLMIGDLLSFAGESRMPALKEISTNAQITAGVRIEGIFNPSTEQYPEVRANISIPKANISHTALSDKGTVSFKITADSGLDGIPSVAIDEMKLNFAGIDINATAISDNILDDDPLFKARAEAAIDLGTLSMLLPQEMGISADGQFSADFSGDMLLSQMKADKFGYSGIRGHLHGDSLRIDDLADTLHLFMRNVSATFGKGMDDALLSHRISALAASIDSLSARAGESTSVRGRNVKLTVQNSPSIQDTQGGKESNPVVGVLRIGRIMMREEGSFSAGISNSKSEIRYSSYKDKSTYVPRLHISSENGQLFARSGVNRVRIKEADFSFEAVKAPSVRERSLRRHAIDSLQKVYPGVPRDSLFIMMGRKREIPDYLSEKEFRKRDIDIKLDESLAQYVRDWNIGGEMHVESGSIMTPYFPIQNNIGHIHGTFDNNTIELENFTFSAGASDISANAYLKGLKRALTSRGILDLIVNMKSEKIDAQELLNAYNSGLQYEDKGQLASAMDDSVDDSSYMKQISAGGMAEPEQYSLFVVPSNLRADISLDARNITYSDLFISKIRSRLSVGERCIQVKNTALTSNMGDISFEGFYSTRTKKDIKAGFNIDMADITADKVINLMPQVDSIMPMLKAFKGNLDMQMAATSDLDTNMNFVTQSISGIMRISGRDLYIDESGDFKKLAKLLMFKDKKVGKIDNMSVQGLIRDDRMEIFPFNLKIDRYSLALSGLQNFDQSFQYHVSVMKSPLPFRFGVNLYGNFDDWKYRIGKARYKSPNSIPVFSAQIDTIQMNLVNSIHSIFSKGADLAVRLNQEAGVRLIEKQKELTGYSSDTHIEELEDSERTMLNAWKNLYGETLEPVENIVHDELNAESEIEQILEKEMMRQSVKEARRMKSEIRKQNRKEARAARKSKSVQSL